MSENYELLATIYSDSLKQIIKAGQDGEPAEVLYLIARATLNSFPAPSRALTPEESLPPLCDECGINRADPPSKLCPGCEAYKDHQS